MQKIQRRPRWPIVLACLLVCGMTPVAFADESADADSRAESVAPVLWLPAMNVFRRFSTEPEPVYQFYGDVLGLDQMQTFNVGGSTGVARFQAGGSVVKFTGRVPGRQYQSGGVRDATGLRLLTFFFPDEAALVERFTAHDYPAPRFESVPGSNRKVALVADPDGQRVKLVVVPGASAETYERIEIGLTVADIERSRAFYREFVGLEELEPVEDRLFDTTRYPFRHGTTTINLRSFGADLPADTGSGGIQYVVSDVDHVAALTEKLAEKYGVTVDQPLSELAGFSLRTIWLDDPDGITNYFAETSASRQSEGSSSE